MKSSKNFATHSFAAYCFLLAIYLSVGSWVQYHYGLWGIAFNEVVFLLLPALLYSKVIRIPWSRCFPIEWPTWPQILIVLLLTSLIIIPSEWLIRYQEQFFPPPKQIQDFYDSLVAHRGWHQVFLQMFALAVVPAFCEEFFFRGFLQSLLEDHLGQVGRILLIALLFAIAHMNPWYLTYYFVLGIYLGLLREWGNNLSWCILAHLLNNLYSLYNS